MRLLITTQTLDRTDPKLGFFHAWVTAFAPLFEHIHVIALEVGDYALPANVSVHSLGRERGRAGKLAYTVRFWQHLRELRGKYDAVFVHMNAEYVPLGMSFWGGKRVALWHNHEHGGWQLALASLFADRLLHTSPYAASARTRKSLQMPAGIDTSIFAPQKVVVQPRSVYFQGRISRAKRVHVLLEAMRTVPDASVTLVGPSDPSYEAMLRSDYADLIDAGRVVFAGPIPHADTPARYAAHTVSVNLTAAGNFDKSVLESIACGTPAVVSSPAFSELVPIPCYFKEGDAASLAQALSTVLRYTEAERAALVHGAQKTIVEKHSLTALATAIRALYV